ncbi:MAG: recombinase family protein, partial [bacterium]
ARRRRGAAERPQPAPGAVRCAVYLRRSLGVGRGPEGASLAVQREAAERYIASRRAEGWTAVGGPYEDAGHSGARVGRPGLSRLLADVEVGAVDRVVVYKVDRLGRSFLDFAWVVRFLEGHGAGLVSVTERFDTGETTGRAMLNMLLAFAQFEREVLGERVRDRLAAARRRGQWHSGGPMLGCRVDPAGGGLVVEPGEARVVREIFEVYLERGSTIEVVAELARRGRRTRVRTTRGGRRIGGVPFTTAGVSNILRNITCTGNVCWDGRGYPGGHEAIVPEETFNAAAELLARHRHGPAYLARCRAGALLDGLVYCRPCAAAMGHFYVDGRGQRHRFYTCTHTGRRRAGLCPTKVVGASGIEEAVVSALRHLAEAAGRGAEGTGAPSLGPALSVLEAQGQALAECRAVRVLRALVERVDYDGRDGAIRLTLTPAGARRLGGAAGCPREGRG